MTTQPTFATSPIALIDVHAIEQQARAARAEMSHEAFAALATSFKQLAAKFRPSRQGARDGQPQTGSYA